MSRPRFVLALAGVTACATGTGYQPPATAVAPSFRSAEMPSPAPAAPRAVTFSAEPPRTEFWKELGDTGLVRLVDEGLRANLDIAIAEARVRQSRAARLSAGLDFAPTITANGGYTRQRTAPAQFGGTFTIPDLDLWTAGFDASWELDLFGRIRSSYAAQGALVAAAAEDLRGARITIASEIARTYFELRGTQAQLAFARDNAGTQQRTLDLVVTRLDAGRGTAFDTERARAQLNTTLASIPSLAARVAQAQYRLGVLVGRSPEALAAELAIATPLPELPATVRSGTPRELVRQRPDIVSAERQLAAQQGLLVGARTEFLPKVTLGGSAGFTSNTLGSLAGAGTTRFALGPVISWPAFNLGRVKAHTDAARARRDEARARYEQVVLQAMADAESALIGYEAARERLDRLQDAATASEKAEALARLRFEGGVADFLQVLDAERTLLEAQDRLAQGRTDAATAFVALYKALGGAWPTEKMK